MYTIVHTLHPTPCLCYHLPCLDFVGKVVVIWRQCGGDPALLMGANRGGRLGEERIYVQYSYCL